MQDRIRINGEVIWQPDKDSLSYNFESTYTEDSTRVQTGKGYFTPQFTVEQLGYSAKNVPQAEATKILQMVDSGEPFTLHYFSLHYGVWRDGLFYVGMGNLNIGSLNQETMRVASLAFNMTGVDPIH